MPLFRPLFVCTALGGILLVAAQHPQARSQKSAQKSRLLAAQNSARSSNARSGRGRALPARQTAPFGEPAPAPTLGPRFAGQKVIRVGLSTAGGAISVYAADGATLFDLNQPGLTLDVAPGARLNFTFGPERASKRGARVFRGPVSVATASGLSDGWTRVYLAVKGEAARVTTNNNNPRWGRPYRGDLEVFPQKLAEPNKRKGPLALVNVLPLEAYLKGVVPWEMGPDAPLEALKAQAICARTKTLDFVQTKRFAAGDFDVCDYDACQGYPGTENEKPRTSQAVEATQGLALFYGGRPIDAVYSTNSGGITAAARDVWRGGDVPYLQSVPDFPLSSPIAALWKGGMSEADWAQFCAQDWPSYARPTGVSPARYETRKYRWSQFISVAEATRAFAAQGFARVTNLEIAQRAASGHIAQLRVSGMAPVSPLSSLPPASKSLVLEGDGKIRAMFSKQLGSTTALPSSLFVISPVVGADGRVSGWNFQGAGWGHGVGMCQRGAQNHALEGWDARQILGWYYRGVEIHSLS